MLLNADFVDDDSDDEAGGNVRQWEVGIKQVELGLR